jgi:hypothetical protein
MEELSRKAGAQRLAMQRCFYPLKIIKQKQ